jgi:thiol-disulfide isomerase/thioredoxin
MKRPSLPYALTALCAVALLACRAAAPLPPLTGSAPSDRPVAFQVPFHAKPGVWDPAMDRGHVILVDVWATWCEPCRDALPIWQDVAKEYGGRGLKVYALSVDEDPAQVAKFIAETRLTLPVLMDQNGKIAESVLKVKMMPTSFLIDRKGRIRYVNEGFAEDHLAKYQKQIELLLAERK